MVNPDLFYDSPELEESPYAGQSEDYFPLEIDRSFVARYMLRLSNTTIENNVLRFGID